eukprot:scaffold2735_cov107-Skeletonema_marinoi.AAC.4
MPVPVIQGRITPHFTDSRSGLVRSFSCAAASSDFCIVLTQAVKSDNMLGLIQFIGKLKLSPSQPLLYHPTPTPTMRAVNINIDNDKQK